MWFEFLKALPVAKSPSFLEEGLHRQQQVLLNLSELNIEDLSICLSAADVANKNAKTISEGHLNVMGIYRKSAEQLTKRDYNYHKL